jgi:hypothetical protein
LPFPATATEAAILTLGLAGVASAATAIDGDPRSSTGLGTPVGHEVQADFEGLFASDIQLTQSTVTYGLKHDSFVISASAALNTFDLDYQPAAFDFLGFATGLDELRWAGALAGEKDIIPSLTLFVAGGLYDGFSDYRSLWLNEYYRQQFAALPGYVAATPRGEQVSGSVRWEYLPAAGYLQADVGYFHDEIAPGYEIDFDGLRRGRPDLYTTAYRLAFENIVARRIRVKNEFRIGDTTNRELRYSYQGSLNLALGERWVIRLYGGYTEESPTFTAWYAGGAAEVELAGGWLLGISGRYYSDTGEIEDALFSSAAPGLEAWQIGLGARRVWGSTMPEARHALPARESRTHDARRAAFALHQVEQLLHVRAGSAM